MRDWFEFFDQHALGWSQVRLEDVGRFVAWLRLPAAARVGNVAALPTAESVYSEATANRKLSAIAAFYEFHHRHGVDLGDLLVTWQRRKAHGGSWRPLLAHLGSRPERSRRIRMRAQRRIPDTLDGEQMAAIVGACDRLRDGFLFTLLGASGLRIGEALGLRHSDIDAAARLVAVVPRINANRARAKGAGGRRVPVPARVIRLYADYLHGEYGDLDLLTELSERFFQLRGQIEVCAATVLLRARTRRTSSGSGRGRGVGGRHAVGHGRSMAALPAA